jgi:chaperonin GroEL (HSP60 family)
MILEMSQLLMMVTIIRNIGATILKQLEVEHPAAKVLVELAQIQDREVGDGTTSVVLLAAELLKVTLYNFREETN